MLRKLVAPALATLGALGAVPLLLVLTAAPVGAGGGCHGAYADGATEEVAAAANCWSPAVARVPAGSPVRFTNRDPVGHNVVGAFWTQSVDLAPGESAWAAFGREGVYPYACTIHPGMVGAVVVGDATAQGDPATVALTMGDTPPRVAQVAAPADAQPVAMAAGTAESSSLRAPVLVVGAFGVAGLLGVAVMATGTRLGRSRPTLDG